MGVVLLHPRRKAELVLLLNTLIWGGTFVAIKWGLREISPAALVFFRFSLASLLYLPFLLYSLFQGTPLQRGAVVRGGMLGVAMFLGYGLQTMGMEYTTASRSAFITQLLVLFTPLFQFLLERRSPGPGEIPGILLVVTGLYFLTSPGGGGPNAGDWWTLLCAISFALYIVGVDLFTPGHNLEQILFTQMAVTALLSGAILLQGSMELSFPRTVPALLVVTYLTLPGTLLVIFLQNRYQKESTPVRASVLFTMEPVFASLFAFLILEEKQTLEGVAGGALIVGGILYTSFQRGLSREKREASPLSRSRKTSP